MANPIKLTSNKILAILICAVIAFCFIYSVSAQGTIVNASALNNQPLVGSTLTVTLTISSVQNLAGIDATIQWVPAVLTLANVVLNLGNSHSNGVLHGTNLNYDSNNLNSGDIYVQETKVAGSYHLVAQSIGASNPGFTGSGTFATLTFNVVKPGPAGLSLQTALADHPASGATANLIDHQDIASSVTAVASGSSSTPTSSSSPTSSTTPTPSVPEFPSTIVIALFIAIAIAVTVFTAKKANKNTTAASSSTPLHIN